MIITLNGLTIRLNVNSISLLGRATQGVRVINLKGDDRIASVARVSVEPTVEVADNEDVVENENIEGEDFAENEENNLE
jgi:DNA gyrase subunit A